jgi:kinesin family member 2/24
LAGSEIYDDSKQHSKERMEESKENNKSLMVLKDCVRAKAIVQEGFVHIQFRTNQLTLMLKVCHNYCNLDYIDEPSS